MEGRFIYDCFVLNEKADAVYYHGSQPVMKTMQVLTAGTAEGKSTILVTPGAPETDHTWKYETAATAAELTAPVYGTAFDGGTALAASGAEITPDASHKVVAVIELDAAGLPVGYGTGVLNIG